MTKRRRRAWCVVCGKRLDKKVSRELVGRFWGEYESRLHATMAASQVVKRGETVVIREGWNKRFLVNITRNGGGWRGLSRVCGSGKCLEKLVKRTPILRKKPLEPE
jgi:hypothetical protein